MPTESQALLQKAQSVLDGIDKGIKAVAALETPDGVIIVIAAPPGLWNSPTVKEAAKGLEKLDGVSGVHLEL